MISFHSKFNLTNPSSALFKFHVYILRTSNFNLRKNQIRQKIFYTNSKHDFARYFLVPLIRYWAQKKSKQKDIVLREHTKKLSGSYSYIIYVSQCEYITREFFSFETRNCNRNEIIHSFRSVKTSHYITSYCVTSHCIAFLHVSYENRTCFRKHSSRNL